jgi:uncharacterized protein (DUF58 family)
MKYFNLEKVISKSKKYVFGDLVGNHSAKRFGDGYDFAQISPYVLGDNIRRIDAFSSAKKNELHVREFFESKEINLHIVVCGSGSLYFGTKKLKQDVIAQIIALLGFSAIKEAQSFSFSLVSDKEEFVSFKKKSKNALINVVAKFLAFDLKKKKIDYKILTKYLLKQKRALVFLIGDFFEFPAIQAVAKKHEIIAIRVRDKFENSPEALGELEVVDPSTLQTDEVLLDSKSIANYEKMLKHHDAQINEEFRKRGVKIIDILTHENVYEKMQRAL